MKLNKTAPQAQASGNNNSSDFYNAVVKGLISRPARIPPKFFYDQAGSTLFERICETPEYYLTRVETEILNTSVADIAAAVGEGTVVIEPGAGNAQKIRILLPRLRPLAYVPIDISERPLALTSDSLRKEFPWLHVQPHCGDFTDDLYLCFQFMGARKLMYFPGSTFGNFEPDDAKDFLRKIHNIIEPNGALLIGIDLIKDTSILEAAYNDSSGITAAFNMNLLRRMQIELDAIVNPDNFVHKACYVASKKRIEMHLVSLCDQDIHLNGYEFRFAKGESIHTENSYKFEPAEFECMAREQGFVVKSRWSDPQQLFGVFLLATDANDIDSIY